MILGSLRGDKVTEMGQKITPLPIRDEDKIAFEKISKDTSKLHLVVDMWRIGANLFNTTTEYTHFAPRSGKNHLFEMSIVTWATRQWAVSSVPISYRNEIEEIAKSCGLRLANGIPTLFDEDGAHQFPIDGPTVYTLENLPGGQINDPVERQKRMDEETLACKAIFEKDEAKIRLEMLSKGYSSEQVDRIISKWNQGEEYDERPDSETQ